MAGGKFFALIDELDASEQRLDALAEPLLAKLVDTEKRASAAVEGRLAKLEAAQDYIKRMTGVVERLEDKKADNGGPTLGASAGSPSPSTESTDGSAGSSAQG